jgi:hypothetical protein
VLSGTADVETLAARPGTAEMASLAGSTFVLDATDVVQVLYEMRLAGREALLPPALHPTSPSTLWVLAWRCSSSPVGPIGVVQVRVGCRSGPRTRGFVVGAAVDGTADAVMALQQGWGFRCRSAAVAVSRRYDRVTVDVAAGGRPVLKFVGDDPDPLEPQDLEYTASMNLARTHRGLRLVQVEPRYAIARAERLTPRVLVLDADWWGEPGLRPAFPVVASVAVADVTLPPLRFVSRPDVPAHEGTEAAADLPGPTRP